MKHLTAEAFLRALYKVAAPGDELPPTKPALPPTTDNASEENKEEEGKNIGTRVKKQKEKFEKEDAQKLVSRVSNVFGDLDADRLEEILQHKWEMTSPPEESGKKPKRTKVYTIADDDLTPTEMAYRYWDYAQNHPYLRKHFQESYEKDKVYDAVVNSILYMSGLARRSPGDTSKGPVPSDTPGTRDDSWSGRPEKHKTVKPITYLWTYVNRRVKDWHKKKEYRESLKQEELDAPVGHPGSREDEPKTRQELLKSPELSPEEQAMVDRQEGRYQDIKQETLERIDSPQAKEILPYLFQVLETEHAERDEDEAYRNKSGISEAYRLYKADSEKEGKKPLSYPYFQRLVEKKLRPAVKRTYEKRFLEKGEEVPTALQPQKEPTTPTTPKPTHKDKWQSPEERDQAFEEASREMEEMGKDELSAEEVIEELEDETKEHPEDENEGENVQSQINQLLNLTSLFRSNTLELTKKSAYQNPGYSHMADSLLKIVKETTPEEKAATLKETLDNWGIAGEQRALILEELYNAGALTPEEVKTLASKIVHILKQAEGSPSEEDLKPYMDKGMSREDAVAEFFKNKGFQGQPPEGTSNTSKQPAQDSSGVTPSVTPNVTGS
jgi:hypothetical protein